MVSHPSSRLSRRHLLKGGLAASLLLLSTSMTSVGRAAVPISGAFDFDSFSERMQQLAAMPYEAPAVLSSDFYASLDYDGYRRVQFDVGQAKWLDDAAGYRIHAFPMGWLFREPVAVFEVADGAARPMAFDADDFNFFFDGAARDAAHDAAFPGVAGFRVNYPLNRPDSADELISFLGASYFRALGRENVYGLSARGLVINSWRDGDEEFPRFSEFYLERPSADGPLTIYAALESPSVTGAYRFVVSPASDARQTTEVETTARLYFRRDVAEVGIAPLTSMFLFAETNRSRFDDYRPQVHDSNGLLLEPAAGGRLWRPLNNTEDLGNSYLWNSGIGAFGLYQRDRNFETYQDAGAHYERRPSVRVEPVGDWGEGSVRLIEVPSRLEADDNIVAFWIPAEPVFAGDSREYSYRLSWGDLLPEADDPLAHVAETRVGQGGVSGVENATSLRKFVIDFAGGQLADMGPDSQFDIDASVSAGSIASTTFSRVPANGLWRLVLDVETAGQPIIELKAAVSAGAKPLTETWIYQWRGAAA